MSPLMTNTGVLHRPLQELQEERGLADITTKMQIANDQAIVRLWRGCSDLLGVCLHGKTNLDEFPGLRPGPVSLSAGVYELH